MERSSVALSWVRHWVLDNSALRVVAVLMACAYVSLAVLALLLQNSLMFHPPVATYEENPSTERVAVGKDRYLVGSFARNPSAKYTLLLSHGNAEDLGQRQAVVRHMLQQGFSVYSYDYEGYGHSSPGLSEQSFYDDILAAFDHLVAVHHVPAHRIIAYGRSIGGGPSVELAVRRPVAALALESTFRSAFRVGTGVKILPFDAFDNGSKLGRVSCPILVMHGKVDTVIPYWHGEFLYASARGPKLFLPVDSAGHMDVIWEGGAAWAASMQQLAKMAERAGP